MISNECSYELGAEDQFLALSFFFFLLFKKLQMRDSQTLNRDSLALLIHGDNLTALMKSM